MKYEYGEEMRISYDRLIHVLPRVNRTDFDKIPSENIEAFERNIIPHKKELAADDLTEMPVVTPEMIIEWARNTILTSVRRYKRDIINEMISHYDDGKNKFSNYVNSNINNVSENITILNMIEKVFNKVNDNFNKYKNGQCEINNEDVACFIPLFKNLVLGIFKYKDINNVYLTVIKNIVYILKEEFDEYNEENIRFVFMNYINLKDTFVTNSLDKLKDKFID